MSPAEPTDRIERAAALLNRLVSDSEFRTRFRRDPAGACRAHGLPDLADELSARVGMHTLDIRESKSSLAGVVLAAAFEGVSAHQLLEQVGPSIGSDVAGVIDRALTLSHLDAIKGALGGDPTASATAPPAAAPLAAAAGAPVAPAAGEIPGMEEATAPPTDADAGGEAGEEGAAGAGADAGEAGAEESGSGEGDASAQELLDNPNLDLPPEARADIEAGELDPRLAGVLDRLTEDHEIGLSVIKTGHDKFTSSGSVSNHFHGRGIDIATVDGQPVSPGNVAARDVATEIAALEADIRPTEVGTPFPISAPGFFTDGAHLDHIHVAFDTELHEGFEAPAGGDQEAAEPGVAGEESELEFAGGDLEYPGDDASKPELAGWMAAHAEKAGLPPELPVMAALVESNLENVSYGDADSLGYFQMRTSIWNTGEWAGFPENPDLQIKWFIDHAVAVQEQQGLTGDDPSTFGEWVADVEMPAEEYRYRYQEQLEAAQQLLKEAGAFVGGEESAEKAAAAPAEGGFFAPEQAEPRRDTVQFAPVGSLPVSDAEGTPAGADVDLGSGGATGGAEEMVEWAESYLGTTEGSAAHQEWASALGFSSSLPWCSIFVANGLKELGVELPANPAYSGAWLDWSGGQTVDLAEIQPGDLVIYDWGDGGITDHIALYAGDEKVIGGNQSDMVSEVPLDRGAVVGVVRPDYP